MLDNIFYQTALSNDNNIKSYFKKKKQLMYVP